MIGTLRLIWTEREAQRASRFGTKVANLFVKLEVIAIFLGLSGSKYKTVEN